MNNSLQKMRTMTKNDSNIISRKGLQTYYIFKANCNSFQTDLISLLKQQHFLGTDMAHT